MNVTDLDSFKQDHGYISVDPLEGIISIPSGLDCFKQTHSLGQIVVSKIFE